MGVVLFSTAIFLSLTTILSDKLEEDRSVCYFIAFVFCAYLLFGPVKEVLVDIIYWDVFERNKEQTCSNPTEASFWFYCKPYYALNREIVRHRAESDLSIDYYKLKQNNLSQSKGNTTFTFFA